MSDTSSPTFPHAVLTALPTERPTQVHLKRLHQEINANAISVPSTRGNGLLGHFALVVPADRYTATTGGIPFIAPVHPGPAPIHAAGATGPQINETNRQYLADLNEYTIYIKTESALKKQVLEAVPSTFTDALMDETIGFANVTVLEILNHLDQQYGTITPADLDANIKAMNAPWTEALPIEHLFEQVRRARMFAQQADPISEATALRSLIQNLTNTGLFHDALRDWRKRDPAEHTLANFQLDFTKADTERRLHLTTASAGYHQTANAAIHDDTSTSPTTPTTISSKKRPAPDTAHLAQAPAKRTPAAPPTTLYYCWSHGYGPKPDHTSATCRTPAPGHRIEATVTNMLGGCNVIHRRRGEVGVYAKPQRNDQKPRTPAKSPAPRNPPPEAT